MAEFTDKEARMAAEESWRLRAELTKGALDEAVSGVRGGAADAADDPLPEDVVVTHDGDTLFAYASSRASIEAARREVEALPHEAAIVISRWDVEEWVQVDPPLDGTAEQGQRSPVGGGESAETRTMVASAGRQVRAEMEVVMQETASRFGLQLSITEHRHLLSSQLLFEVTGPKHGIDEFAKALNAYEMATMRTERAVMMSPL